jgi:crotonobetainyl-CoA:carnitine CoA-transferase CaiB-like acyl-CoA transferase
MTSTANQLHGPLKGVRVVDLTAMVMGPYATQIMADLGAEVIKIEPPEGDNTRYISAGPERGMCGIYVNCNRGKRSVMLDLRSEEGKASLRQLIATADVFVHSMRASAIAKLGFAYPEVAAIKPDIVYVNGYGYGRRGRYGNLPAYDDTIQAECGIPDLQAKMTGEPGFAATIMADKISGLHVLYAALAALYHRAATGEGQEVEVPMFESMASFMLVEHANGAVFDPPQGPAYYPRATAPNRRPYKTKDGYVAALIYNDKHWGNFVAAVQPEWATPEMNDFEARARQIGAIYGKLAETFAQRTTAEWLELLTANQIPCAPLRSTEELMSDPHLEEVGFFETVESEVGTLRLPGLPVWFSKTPGGVQGPTVRLGTDTEAVLAELGAKP